jgi:hypothetical protein
MPKCLVLCPCLADDKKERTAATNRSSALLPSPRWYKVFLLLGGRQGPKDVAPYPLKDAAKVSTFPDMAKRNFTLPKWQTENQRQKPD